METVTFENAKIRVTIPVAVWERRMAEYGATAQHVRGTILSDAMAQIGYRWTEQELRGLPEPTETECRAWAEDSIFIREIFHGQHPYSPVDIMRRIGGNMSAGMASVVAEARKIARETVTADDIEAARKKIVEGRARDAHFYRARGNWPGWEIEVIGELPKQIGMNVNPE